MEKDHKKMLIGIIVFLILAVIALAGYIVLDKKMKPKQVELNSESIESTEEISLSDVNNLVDTLVTSDHEFGLYSTETLNSETSSNAFLAFNIQSYILDNNIDLKEEIKVCGSVDEEKSVYKISKSSIDEYINKKYNTTVKYNYNQSNKTFVTNMTGTLELYSYDENNWAIVCASKGGAGSYIGQKLDKYEEDGDNLYIYTKVVSCSGELGDSCQTEISNEMKGVLFYCSVSPENSENCPNIDAKETKDYADYAIENMYDKLHTYKHTFKKVDGKYYWQSSELQTN